MRKQERGARSEEQKGGAAIDLRSPASDPDFLKRVRWRCRRGLLELDIVLERFVEARYASLDTAQQAAFDELLDMPDTKLWDMVSGKQLPQQELHRIVLEWIKAA